MSGELEDLAVTGRDPVAAVGVAPGDRAAAVHLQGDRLELVPVFRRVPVEVVLVLLAVGVVEDFIYAHAGPPVTRCDPGSAPTRPAPSLIAPSLASRTAWLRPWPRAAPLMKATLP